MKLQKSNKSSSNYQKQLDSLLQNLSQQKDKPSLLIHACCGPCSSYVLEYLSSFFNITVFFYNPNIYPKEEYFRRLNELKDFYTKFPPVLQNKIQLIEENYDPADFFEAIDIKGNPEFENEAEKGERCRRCYSFRLKKAFEYANLHNFDYFCTTLSISPFKDAQKINAIGTQLEAQFSQNTNGTKWLTSDFKKKGGFKRSLEISSEYNLYRQTYCGCVYSFKNSMEKNS